MNTYNFPTFGVVALVILVFVGVGALTYYAVDLTQNYYELMEDLAVAQNQVEALNNENETLKKMNADMTNRNNVLVAENSALKAEKASLTTELQSCRLQVNLVPAVAHQSTLLPSNPRSSIILVILLIAAALAGTLSFKHFRTTPRNFRSTRTIDSRFVGR